MHHGNKKQTENHTFNVDAINVDDPIAVRLNEQDHSHAILGRCTRNPITGEVNLKQAGLFTDFSAVDLFERKCLKGHPKDLCKDPYFYKIVPLPYRTWMYHFYFGNEHTLAKSKGNDGIMIQVLEKQVIDAPVRAGRWSSTVLYCPAAIMSCVTADLATVVLTTLFAVLTLAVSVTSNSPRFYELARGITIVPRCVFLVIALIRMVSCADGGVFVIFGFLAILFCAALDICLGDIGAVSGVGFHCNYTVLKVLPNRVFVCRRDGAAFAGDQFGARGQVHEFVTGVGEWSSQMALLAEIRGLVVELQPMTLADWNMAWEERADNRRPISFIGLDIFKPGLRTIDALMLEERKKGLEGRQEALMALIDRPDSQFTKSSTMGRSATTMTKIAGGV